MFTVYILQSQVNGRHYIGHTEDMLDRLRRHNAGSNKYTQRYRPWNVVYTEMFDSRGEAMKRENQIKRMKSKKYIEGLIRSIA